MVGFLFFFARISNYFFIFKSIKEFISQKLRKNLKLFKTGLRKYTLETSMQIRMTNKITYQA